MAACVCGSRYGTTALARAGLTTLRFRCSPSVLRLWWRVFLSVSNAGLTDKFKEALDEANSTGVPWAMSMTRRRQEVMDKKEVRRTDKLDRASRNQMKHSYVQRYL